MHLLHILLFFPMCVFPVILQLKVLLNQFSSETLPLPRTAVLLAATAKEKYLQVRRFPRVPFPRFEILSFVSMYIKMFQT